MFLVCHTGLEIQHRMKEIQPQEAGNVLQNASVSDQSKQFIGFAFGQETTT